MVGCCVCFWQTLSFAEPYVPPPSTLHTQVISTLRRGHHPFDSLGITSCFPRLSAALGRLLTLWHPAFGLSSSSLGGQVGHRV